MVFENQTALVTVGHDDVHTKLEMCRDHFEKTGRGGDFVKQFVR